MRTIWEGDYVTICWSSALEETKHCLVKHTPGNNSDLWFLYQKDIGDFALNPHSSNFELMIKEKKENG